MKTNAEVFVNNLEDYVKEHHVCVARLVDNELWFYGAYDSYEKAVEVCKELGECSVLFSVVHN